MNSLITAGKSQLAHIFHAVTVFVLRDGHAAHDDNDNDDDMMMIIGPMCVLTAHPSLKRLSFVAELLATLAILKRAVVSSLLGLSVRLGFHETLCYFFPVLSPLNAVLHH